MPDYQKGKIYAIRSYETDELYIGSTVEKLSKRMSKHRSSMKSWKNGKTNYITSYKILEYPTCYIELLETYPCNSKEELCKKEGEYIRDMECVNKVIPSRTRQEYVNDNKEQIARTKKEHYEDNKQEILQKNKEYYEENKEHILQQNKEYREKNKEKISQKVKEYRDNNKEQIAQTKKEYYEDNKEQIAQHVKEYYEANKEQITQQKKEYYKANKEKINEKNNVKYTCDCGGKYSYGNKAIHEKTKKHTGFIESQNRQ
jgi:hypothetical protein